MEEQAKQTQNNSKKHSEQLNHAQRLVKAALTAALTLDLDQGQKFVDQVLLFLKNTESSDQKTNLTIVALHNKAWLQSKAKNISGLRTTLLALIQEVKMAIEILVAKRGALETIRNSEIAEYLALKWQLGLYGIRLANLTPDSSESANMFSEAVYLLLELLGDFSAVKEHLPIQSVHRLMIPSQEQIADIFQQTNVEEQNRKVDELICCMKTIREPQGALTKFERKALEQLTVGKIMCFEQRRFNEFGLPGIVFTSECSFMEIVSYASFAAICQLICCSLLFMSQLLRSEEAREAELYSLYSVHLALRTSVFKSSLVDQFIAYSQTFRQKGMDRLRIVSHCSTRLTFRLPIFSKFGEASISQTNSNEGNVDEFEDSSYRQGHAIQNTPEAQSKVLLKFTFSAMKTNKMNCFRRKLRIQNDSPKKRRSSKKSKERSSEGRKCPVKRVSKQNLPLRNKTNNSPCKAPRETYSRSKSKTCTPNLVTANKNTEASPKPLAQLCPKNKKQSAEKQTHIRQPRLSDRRIPSVKKYPIK